MAQTHGVESSFVCMRAHGGKAAMNDETWGFVAVQMRYGGHDRYLKLNVKGTCGKKT